MSWKKMRTSFEKKSKKTTSFLLLKSTARDSIHWDLPLKIKQRKYKSWSERMNRLWKKKRENPSRKTTKTQKNREDKKGFTTAHEGLSTPGRDGGDIWIRISTDTHSFTLHSLCICTSKCWAKWLGRSPTPYWSTIWKSVFSQTKRYRQSAKRTMTK